MIELTFSTVTRNLVSVGTLTLGISLLSQGIGELAGWALAGTSPPWAAGLVTIPLGLVVHGLLVGCLTQIVVSDLNGHRIGAATALRAAMRVFVPVTLLNLAVGIGVGLASLLLVVPGVMLLTRWFVAAPARVVEDVGIGGALTRSAELTRGHRWRILGLLVIYGLLTVTIGSTLVGVAAGLRAGMMDQAAFGPVAWVVQVVVTAISSAISSAGTATIYAELRRIREGGLPGQLAAVFE